MVGACLRYRAKVSTKRRFKKSAWYLTISEFAFGKARKIEVERMSEQKQ